MRVLIAPDTFGGTLTAVEAANAIAEGWARRCPDDVLDRAPLADGGPGFVDVVATSLGGERVAVLTSGPWGEHVTGEVVMVATEESLTAYIESAQAVGLHLVPRDRRDPRLTSSAGMAALLRAAVDGGATRIVVGLGGTSTNDGGRAMLESLGATFTDGVCDLSTPRQLLSGVDLLVATDVDSPLLGPRGATRGFAAQKFAYPDRVLEVELDDMEQQMTLLAASVGRTPDGRDPSVALGSGAGGGLGFALIALGGRRVPGIDTILDSVRLADRIAGADVVVTGEGRFDWQSLRGKVVSGVSAAALTVGRPVVVVAGQVEVGRRELTASGISAAFSVADHVGSVERAMAQPYDSLASLAERVAATWGG